MKTSSFFWYPLLNFIYSFRATAPKSVLCYAIVSVEQLSFLLAAGLALDSPAAGGSPSDGHSGCLVFYTDVGEWVRVCVRALLLSGNYIAVIYVYIYLLYVHILGFKCMTDYRCFSSISRSALAIREQYCEQGGRLLQRWDGSGREGQETKRFGHIWWVICGG